MALRPNRFLQKNAHPAANGSSSEWNQKRRVFRPWMGGLGVLLLVGVLLLRTKPQPGSESGETAEGIEQTDPAAASNAPRTFDGANSENSAPSSDFSEDLVEPALPTLESVRKEVQANPHETPASLRAFARALSPWMGAALAKDASAESIERTVSFLSRCAGGGEEGAATVGSVRLVCLLNLRRIREARAESHPAIAARVDSILRAAPAELIERLEQAGKLAEQEFPGAPAHVDGEEPPRSH